MTRRWLAVCLLALLLAGCGKYGEPVRSVGAVAGSAGAGATPGSGAGAPSLHPDDCEDPAHEHDRADDDAPDAGTP